MTTTKNNAWFFEPLFSPKEQVWFLYNNRIGQGIVLNLRYKTSFWNNAFHVEEFYDIADAFGYTIFEGGSVGTLRENVAAFQIGRTKEELIQKLLNEYEGKIIDFKSAN